VVPQPSVFKVTRNPHDSCARAGAKIFSELPPPAPDFCSFCTNTLIVPRAGDEAGGIERTGHLPTGRVGGRGQRAVQSVAVGERIRPCAGALRTGRDATHGIEQVVRRARLAVAGVRQAPLEPGRATARADAGTRKAVVAECHRRRSDTPAIALVGWTVEAIVRDRRDRLAGRSHLAGGQIAAPIEPKYCNCVMRDSMAQASLLACTLYLGLDHLQFRRRWLAEE